MAEDSTEAGIMVALDVIYLGHDDRNWKVFWMSPMAPTEGSEEVTRKIVRISLQEKIVELVQQTTALRVFVNPDPREGDEWVVGGKRRLIMSPQADFRQCPRHYRAGQEAGPHHKGHKPFHCGCCAGTCERCLPDGTLKAEKTQKKAEVNEENADTRFSWNDGVARAVHPPWYVAGDGSRAPWYVATCDFG